MRAVLEKTLPRWLMAALTGLWGALLLPWVTGSAVDIAPVLALLLVWTLLLAAADQLAGPGWTWALLAAGETVSFAALGGGEVIGAAVAFHSGALPEPSLAGDAVVLLELAALTCAAYYALERFWPRAAVSLIWTGCWLWAALEERDLPKLALAAMVPVLLLTLAEGIYRLCRRGERGRFAQLTPVLLGLFTAAGALLLVLPTSPEPYGYPILNAIIDKAEELYDDAVTRLFYRQGGEGEFTMAFAGYSDEADTGQGVGDTHQLGGDLLAKAQHPLTGRLYLMGNTWDTFDGRGWTATLSDDGDGLLTWSMDTAQRIYALWRYQHSQEDPVGVTNYCKSTSVYLQYQAMNTRTLFTASNTTRITTDTQRFPWSAEPGRVLFRYLQTRDTYYRVYYLAQNQRLLPALVNSAEGCAYDTDSDLLWRTIFGDYRSELSLTLDVFPTDRRIEPALARREALIYESYLSLPEDLSDEVRALAEDITASCATSYEKLMAIADYLQSHYTYTTEPGPVPEDTAFLDYVLFEAGEGYCTWYATAATLLARCVGIPARYVQGYCLELEGGVLTAVDGSSSHAWCEGYVPGFGWVTVESTPGFEGGGTVWGAVQDDQELPQELPEENGEAAEEPGPASESEEVSGLWLLIGGGLLALLTGGALLWRQLRRRRRYRAASCSERAVWALEAFLRAPTRREYRRQESESLRQYFARLRWSLHLEPEGMEAMTALYEEVLFAGRQLTGEEERTCRAFLRELHRARRRQRWGSSC